MGGSFFFFFHRPFSPWFVEGVNLVCVCLCLFVFVCVCLCLLCLPLFFFFFGRGLEQRNQTQTMDSQQKQQKQEKIHDVVIVGGGIIGVSSAYYLSKYHNVQPLVLEAKEIAWTASGRAGFFFFFFFSFSFSFLSFLLFLFLFSFFFLFFFLFPSLFPSLSLSLFLTKSNKQTNNKQQTHNKGGFLGKGWAQGHSQPFGDASFDLHHQLSLGRERGNVRDGREKKRKEEEVFFFFIDYFSSSCPLYPFFLSLFVFFVFFLLLLPELNGQKKYQYRKLTTLELLVPQDEGEEEEGDGLEEEERELLKGMDWVSKRVRRVGKMGSEETTAQVFFFSSPLFFSLAHSKMPLPFLIIFPYPFLT